MNANTKWGVNERTRGPSKVIPQDQEVYLQKLKRANLATLFTLEPNAFSTVIVFLIRRPGYEKSKDCILISSFAFNDEQQQSVDYDNNNNN